MFSLLRPAPAAPALPAERIDPEYRRLRWQVFTGIFVGYAAFYLVRKNFALALPDILKEHPEYSKAALGSAMTGLSVAYGVSKFIMGSVSDRSNPRWFMTIGLLLTAGVTFAFGTIPAIYGSLTAIIALQTLNGWFNGMGWPPCGKTMVHWWSTRERGLTVSLWNVAHNIGGGLVAKLALVGVLALAAVFGGDLLTGKPEPSAKKTRKVAGVESGPVDLASLMPKLEKPVTSRNAEMFFRQGFREYRARNYIRALNQFELVLQMDPDHEMARRYRDNARLAIEDEVKTHLERGKKDFAAGKLRDARGHYEAILRLLFSDQSNPAYAEAHWNKALAQYNVTRTLSAPKSVYEVEEETKAGYVQLDWKTELAGMRLRGNSQ